MEGYKTLDLSNKNIKKLDKLIAPANVNPKNVISLNLSGNSLPRLDNIDIFCGLIELNASRNQLIRMYHLTKLHNLVKIDLSNNHILSIEGLKELKNLQYLNLSHNNIKVLDANHLQNNVKLEFLDLSYNNIPHITNIAHLTALKVLQLHKNEITNLRHCELYLPGNLDTLTLANNNISDLNEVSHLTQLCNLKELSINGNPCVTMTGNNLGFDYRPFVLNWCMTLRAIDGYAVDDLESLKAEWLYSQGKGRKFRIGEHSALVEYLASVCPLSGKALESVNDRKLRLILSKAQQHQRQLCQEQPIVRRSSSRRSLQNVQQSIMTRSLDPQTLSRKTSAAPSECSSQYSETFEDYAEKRMTRSAHWPEQSRNDSLDRQSSNKTPYTNGEPLPTSTALVPAPDSLISPSMAASLPFYSNSLPQKTSDIIEEDVELCPANLLTIKTRIIEKEKSNAQKTNGNDLDLAATRIQKMWRGYQTRTLDRRVSDIYKQIESMRFSQYIKKLSVDMEATRAALDKEHQLQILQMEAINALWKKISTLQPSPERASQGMNQSANFRVLATNYTQLESQVQMLQSTMQEILNRMNMKVDSHNEATSTQTEIVAVHTPKDPQFPYQKFTARPSTLPLAPSGQLSTCGSEVTAVTTTIERAPSELSREFFVSFDSKLSKSSDVDGRFSPLFIERMPLFFFKASLQSFSLPLIEYCSKWSSFSFSNSAFCCFLSIFSVFAKSSFIDFVNGCILGVSGFASVSSTALSKISLRNCVTRRIIRLNKPRSCEAIKSSSSTN